MIFIRRHGPLGGEIFSSLGRIGIASTVMALPTYWISRLLAPAAGAADIKAQLIHVGGTIIAAGVIYIASASVICRREYLDVRRALLRRPLPPGR